jgi:hypothetical protein
MAGNLARRTFLQTAAAGSAVGLGDLGFLRNLRPVMAEETATDAKVVRLNDDIEPLVRLLEETPRERLLEEVAGRVKSGTSYREVVAALLLAGVRNIQPRPQVGFKFHAVLVVNSAHLASLSSPPEHRWLPIFWALDYFKDAQAADRREGDWAMQPVDEHAVPPAHRAKQAFIEAMDNWDEAAADAAIAGLARTAGANEIYELMFRYGARDFRSIGHKAIYVANSFRTLNCIGWQYAEPVLRSLTYALLMHEGKNPAQRDADADRPWRKNEERAGRIRPEWLEGKVDAGATTDLLAALRTASPDEACEKVVDLLDHGIAPQSVWDALYLSSGELNVRQSGIVALHAVTTTNGLRFAWQMSANDNTRKMLLLQNAAYVTLFREAMTGRGKLSPYELDKMTPQAVESGPAEAVDEICRDISSDRMLAATKLLGYLKQPADAQRFIDSIRLLVFLKGTNSHDYKFSSAVLEDFQVVSPEWRNRFLAASVFNLRGSQGADNRLVARTRGALS